MKINEVDPRNFDSDVDYYAALNAKPKARVPSEPRPSPAQQAADDEDAISQQRQAQHKAFTQKRAVKYVDQEGSAPNGKEYNKLYVIQAQDEATADHEEYMFDKNEWGAKKVVDVEKSKNEDGSVTHTLYIVDNHKHGMWKPWKDKPAEGVAEGSLEEIDRRGFLKGLGAGAAAVAGAGLPTLAQAKGPGYWANYAGKALTDATGGLKIRLRSADIEISTGDSISPMEYMATNVYDLVTKYCELTDCYNAKQAIDNATKEAVKISKIDNFVYRSGSEKQFVLAYRASLNDEVYEWKKGSKPAQKQEQPPQQSAQPQNSAPQEIKLNLKPNRQVGNIITVNGGPHDGKKVRVTQILGPNKEGTGNKGLGVIVESLEQGVAEGMMDNPGDEDSPVAQAIIRRILMQRTDLLAKHGPEKVGAAVDEVADFVGDVEEIGSSDVSGWVKQVEQNLAGMGESMTEASNPEYDDEAGMAKSNLRTMARAVNGLMDTIGDNDNLPEWAQEKIAKAEMMTTSVWDYLLSQKEQGIDPKVENVTKIKEANMESEQGRKNILSILKAVEQGQDAEIMVGGEPITLEYPEARFVGGRYKSFMKAGRQEEFLRALTDARAFDRIMTKMRAVLDKQKNFRGSVPGERGVEEDAPALAKFAGGLGLGVVAAAGAPAIVGILGPLLGIPMAAYGAYSAAKLGMKGVEKLWDMASEKLGGDDKVEQYTQSKIATLPPEQAQAAKAVIKQVAESRRSMAPAVNEGIIDTIKAGAKKAFDKLGGGSDEELLQRLEKETGGKRPEKKDNKKVKESAPPGFDQDLEKKLLKQYKDNPERAYATMWTIHNKQKNENFDQALVNASAQLKENEYFCMLDKQVKLIPEGYKRNSQGFLARK